MSARAEMIGRVFGEFTVLAEAGYSVAKFPKLKYRCQCSCGVVKDVVGEQLRQDVRSCGHTKVGPRPESRYKIGDVLGMLTLAQEIKTKKSVAYLCDCKCGGKVVRTRSQLRRGLNKSCGCHDGAIHGHSRRSTSEASRGNTKTYSSWRGMKERVTNPNSARYKDYGARGITLCDRWMEFKNFLDDMGERPEGKSLDRIDNNKGYSPENCKWSTAVEQRANQRTRAEIGRLRKPYSEWNFKSSN